MNKQFKNNWSLLLSGHYLKHCTFLGLAITVFLAILLFDTVSVSAFTIYNNTNITLWLDISVEKGYYDSSRDLDIIEGTFINPWLLPQGKIDIGIAADPDDDFQMLAKINIMYYDKMGGKCPFPEYFTTLKYHAVKIGDWKEIKTYTSKVSVDEIEIKTGQTVSIMPVMSPLYDYPGNRVKLPGVKYILAANDRHPGTSVWISPAYIRDHIDEVQRPIVPRRFTNYNAQ